MTTTAQTRAARHARLITLLLVAGMFSLGPVLDHTTLPHVGHAGATRISQHRAAHLANGQTRGGAILATGGSGRGGAALLDIGRISSVVPAIRRVEGCVTDVGRNY